ncbi:MAG: Asp-tRNA(Asn)/Glu-tRNA(Gln) amidotransferase subunit GatB [Acidimicrobiia bacterium]|nr:Asp-tRNA(Asn)/Glu-tRNA(Gln) amidotransferase subunit GatB [Acidimicrobiia bacterium]
MTDYEAVIGIETHVELMTNSKMFCGCPVKFGEPPNTTTCPVCLGLPGALPVPNAEAIEGILQIGTALSCDVAETSFFHRKNYFYPDLPKNYQISQYDVPICHDGEIQVEVEGADTTIGITRVHMEEDTGKSIHMGGGGRIHDAEYSLLDFNRSGVPLVEIVTEPDIRSAEQARAYGAELQRIVRTLGVSDARLEEGSMRFDANVSIRPVGDSELGTRAEVKNVNSLRSLQRAVAFEIQRQIELVESGGTVVQETRHWNEDSGKTTSMRSKEESEDYRYFQEPDLVPIEVSEQWRDAVVNALPELPAAQRTRYRELGVDARVAAVLVGSEDGIGELFEGAMGAGGDPRLIGNWLSGEAVAWSRAEETAIGDTPLTSAHLVELAKMVGDSTLSSSAAKQVLAGVLEGEGSPAEVAEARDLVQISDASVIEAEVDAVLAEHEDAVASIRGGDNKPFGFLVGQVMRATGGKADPKQVSDLIRTKTSG